MQTGAPVSLPARFAAGSPYLIAWWYALAGQREQSLEWLQRTYDERVSGLSQLGVEPAFDVLRADPRFIDIMRGVGLGT